MILISSIISMVLLGLPLSYALTRRLPLALLFAPMATALTAATATVLMLIVGGNLLLWMPVALAVQWLLAWRLLKRNDPPLPHGSWLDAAIIALPLCLPFLMVGLSPVEWDAHSIWWLRAGYFSHGAEFARAAIANPAYDFAHPDYPPLATSPLAVIWTGVHPSDFYLAQFTSSLLTFSAISALVYAVRRVTASGPAVASWLAAIGVGLATWIFKPATATAGLSDPIWAATFTAAAVLLLFGRSRLDRPTLPIFLMTVTALTKNEGFIMVVILAAAATLREAGGPRQWRTWGQAATLRRIALYWVPVGIGALWTVLVRSLGGTSDLTRDGRFGDLLSGELGARRRLSLIYHAYEARFGTVLILAVAVAVLGAIFLRRQRRNLGLGSDLWLWAVNCGYAASLTLTYLITPHDLRWHLATSLNRVALPLVLMACVSAVCWAVIALAPDRGPTAAASPE